MNTLKLKKLQKKGSMNFDSTTSKLIGSVVVIVLITAFAPTIFGNITNLSAVEGAPAWLGVILPLLVAVGIMFMIWKAIK